MNNLWETCGKACALPYGQQAPCSLSQKKLALKGDRSGGRYAMAHHLPAFRLFTAAAAAATATLLCTGCNCTVDRQNHALSCKVTGLKGHGGTGAPFGEFFRHRPTEPQRLLPRPNTPEDFPGVAPIHRAERGAATPPTTTTTDQLE